MELAHNASFSTNNYGSAYPDECEQEKKNKQMVVELLVKRQNRKYFTNYLL